MIKTKKVSETPISTKKAGMVVCAYNPSYTGDIDSKIRSEVSLEQKAQEK
jgi:hypothetical protein